MFKGEEGNSEDNKKSRYLLIRFCPGTEVCQSNKNIYLVFVLFLVQSPLSNSSRSLRERLKNTFKSVESLDCLQLK